MVGLTDEVESAESEEEYHTAMWLGATNTVVDIMGTANYKV
jgi:hypothetical protein